MNRLGEPRKSTDHHRERLHQTEESAQGVFVCQHDIIFYAPVSNMVSACWTCYCSTYPSSASSSRSYMRNFNRIIYDGEHFCCQHGDISPGWGSFKLQYIFDVCASGFTCKIHAGFIVFRYDTDSRVCSMSNHQAVIPPECGRSWFGKRVLLLCGSH